MATKYVMIPEDMYRALINEKKESKSTIDVNFAKSNVEKAKKSNLKDKSAKNILYNQELRRYLKTYKEEKDKPIKIELPKEEQNNRGVVINTNDMNERPALFMPTNDRIETDWRPAHLFNFGTSMQTPKNKYKLRPTYSPPSDDRSERILSIIRRNPALFSVTRDMKVISKLNKPINKSNVIESVERIIKPDVTDNYSPPGTSILRQKIFSDPVTSAIYKEGLKQQKNLYGETSGTQEQEGDGIKYKKKILKRLFSNKKTFRPSLWT